jgi:mono/diheme cytochrome c family protein
MKRYLSTTIRKGIMVMMVFTMVFLVNSIQAQDGEKLFQQCIACHTVGQGKRLGPDLLDVSKKRDLTWVKNFIKSSQSMIKSGDPEAMAVFEEFNKLVMIDYPLPDADIEAIIKYIDSFSTPDEENEVEASASDSLSAIKESEYLASIDTDENEARGKALFEGSRNFKNGGASCISCHHVFAGEGVQGGLLAKDLTQSFSRIGGLAGIKGIIDFPPYPAMKDAYAKALITEEESVQLQVFLMRADKAYSWSESSVSGFMKQGIIGMFVLLIIISLVWYKRKRRSVNSHIIQRQRR